MAPRCVTSTCPVLLALPASDSPCCPVALFSRAHFTDRPLSSHRRDHMLVHRAHMGDGRNGADISNSLALTGQIPNTQQQNTRRLLLCPCAATEFGPLSQGEKRRGCDGMGEGKTMEGRRMEAHMSAHELLRVGRGGCHAEDQRVECRPLPPSSETKTGYPGTRTNPFWSQMGPLHFVTCSSGAARQGRPCLTGCRAYWVRRAGPRPISVPLADLHMIL